MRTVNGLQKESCPPTRNKFLRLVLMDEGNCRRFLKFCKRIIYKTLRQFHEAKADLQGQLIQLP